MAQQMRPPVMRLVADVLAEIFILCLPPDGITANPSAREAPMNVSLVARSWRRVALATPRLWLRLFAHSGKDVNGLDVGRCAELWTLWLARSSNMPLDVDFALNNFIPSRFQLLGKGLKMGCLSNTLSFGLANPRLFGMSGPSKYEAMAAAVAERTAKIHVPNKFLETLISHQARWKRVSLHCTVERSSRADPLIISDMGMLEELRWEVSFVASDSVPAKVALDLTHSAKLQSLRLQGTVDIFTASACLASLHTLELSPGAVKPRVFPSASVCVFLLQAAPNLVDFTVDFPDRPPIIEPGKRHDLEFPHVVAEKLLRLTMKLGESSDFAVSVVLLNLTAPALEHLDIGGEDDELWDFLPPFLLLSFLPEFMERSPNIKFFRVFHIIPEDIMTCIGLLRNVEELWIRDADLPGLFDALTLRSGAMTDLESDMCPKLRKLALVHSLELDEENFEDMVLSRWKRPAEPTFDHPRLLESISLIRCVFVEEDVTEGVRACVSEGLKLDFNRWFF